MSQRTTGATPEVLPNEIGKDDPLRLDVAASLAFPDGSMTASGLRNEHKRGRLVIMRIANKDYTTLANIEKMRELCEVPPKDPACGSVNRNMTKPESSLTMPSGSSEMESIKKAHAAALATVEQLSASSRTTSPENTSSPQRGTSATRIRSQSRT
jgi:hypothetical protein